MGALFAHNWPKTWFGDNFEGMLSVLPNLNLDEYFTRAKRKQNSFRKSGTLRRIGAEVGQGGSVSPTVFWDARSIIGNDFLQKTE